MPVPIQLLVVDDDPEICHILEESFPAPQYSTLSVQNSAGLKETLKKNYFDVVLLDLYLADADGLDVLKEIKKTLPGAEVIMMTGNASLETAVEAMRQGAYDYVPKPFDPKELETRLQKAYEKSLLSAENSLLKEEIRHDAPFSEMIGASTEIKNLQKLVRKVAPSEAPVLITGESGSGKELLARAIHNLSSRKEKPFVALNCSNLEKELLESELFGYVPGAFTGANNTKPGLLECANGGTFLIDEIGDMDQSVQPKLLRVLETREFRRLGDTRTRKIDVRILAASHKNLKKEIEKGAFREDLFYRLNVVELEVPPLRKRKEDIPVLIRHFLSEGITGSDVKGIQNEALKVLLQYDFPGNIRELRNIIERSAILSSGSVITLEDLPQDIQERLRVGGETRKNLTLDDFVSREEHQYIQHVLELYGGNKTKAAQALGISRRNLYRKLELYQSRT